ncbi:MAG: GAF domain-containing protein [Bacteroides sp.]|nr:GAF domain-containing protein [Bacteroides sp.]MBR4047439.1 GAF domain-containing protein [Bacteroides sp.]
MKRRYQQFSQVLSKLLHANDINKCVTEILQDILNETKSDRVYIFSYNKELTHQRCIFEVVSKPEYAVIESLQEVPLSATPWWHKQLLEDKPIIIADLNDMPRKAESEYEILNAQGIKSIFVEPLLVNGKVWGYIGIDYVENYHTPEDDEIETLYNIAGAIGVNIRFDEIQKAEREERKELAIAKQKAEEANRMKSAFLANMSHEIRTPLNIILSFTELMLEENNLNERKEYFSIVKRNSDGLLNIINDLLDMSKIEAGMLNYQIAGTDLNLLCKEVVNDLSSTTQNDVKLLFKPEKDSFIINTDKQRLRQVIVNLVSNACKFTTEGEITISYKQLSTDCLEIRVTDTGIGIATENIPKLFNRFTKLNSNAKGTGLGLVICKSIIEHLGGEIGIESELGKGSSFWFTHPIS